MQYSYRPKGVCSRQMTFDLENGVIHNLKVEGGCDGNLKGIGALVEGMEAKDAIARLRGITCGPKRTSCPDQLSYALEEALASKE